MRINLLLFVPLLFLYFSDIFSLSVSPDAVKQIGEKIWKNECGGTIDGLTTWNKGENFGSFGIGHFIWYAQDKRERFQETFPSLLVFLQSNGVQLPAWLERLQACPWNSREEFYQQIQSPEMISLRQLLYDTRHLQALFIANRLEKDSEMLCTFSSEQANIAAVFSRLSDDPNGLYALVDYSNFKGMGTSLNETYKGQGWGLFQVLQRVSYETNNVVEDFIQSATMVLTERVQNSPPERNERQRLIGWLNRLNTYRPA